MLTSSDVVNLLEQSADDLSAAGFDPSFGWGRVNAYRAVRAAQPAAAPSGANRRKPQPALRPVR